MIMTQKNGHVLFIALIGALMLTSIPASAFSLRETRELCKRHRFKILALTAVATAYIYTNKLIKKAIQDYKNSHKEDGTKMSLQEYAEAFSDAFIKVTKLAGTIFKVFRATTCPDEGKTSGDQWLDDFSQMA